MTGAEERASVANEQRFVLLQGKRGEMLRIQFKKARENNVKYEKYETCDLNYKFSCTDNDHQ